MRRRTFASVGDDQQIHQIIVDGLRRRLNDENVFAANALIDHHLRLAVVEPPHRHIAQFDANVIGNVLRQFRVGIARHQTEFTQIDRLIIHCSFTLQKIFMELLLFASVVPIGEIFLPRPTDRQIIFRHFGCDGGAGGDISALFDLDGRDEIRIATDKHIIADGCAIFFLAVVIAGDRAATHIDIRAHIAIAEILKVRQLGTLADIGIFNLDEVADLDLV